MSGPCCFSCSVSLFCSVTVKQQNTPVHDGNERLVRSVYRV